MSIELVVLLVVSLVLDIFYWRSYPPNINGQAIGLSRLFLYIVVNVGFRYSSLCNTIVNLYFVTDCV